MKHICIFCGSSEAVDKKYLELAKNVGITLGKKGYGIVYGGARVGMMGAVADGALSANAEVIGILPRALQDKEFAHLGLTKLFIVESMAERKQIMFNHSDAFISLPGGFGTLDELFEIVTWAQVGYHNKKSGILNPNGYWDHLNDFVEHAKNEGFIRKEHQLLLHQSSHLDELLKMLDV